MGHVGVRGRVEETGRGPGGRRAAAHSCRFACVSDVSLAVAFLKPVFEGSIWLGRRRKYWL